MGYLSEKVMPTTAPAQMRLVINHRDERSDSPIGSMLGEKEELSHEIRKRDENHKPNVRINA